MKRREFIASLSILPLCGNCYEKPKSVTNGDKTIKMVNGSTITFRDYDKAWIEEEFNEAWYRMVSRIKWNYEHNCICDTRHGKTLRYEPDRIANGEVEKSQ